MTARDPAQNNELPSVTDDELDEFRPRKGRLYSRRNPNVPTGSFETDIVLAKPVDMAVLLGRVDEDSDVLSEDHTSEGTSA